MVFQTSELFNVNGYIFLHALKKGENGENNFFKLWPMLKLSYKSETNSTHCYANKWKFKNLKILKPAANNTYNYL